MGPLTAHEPTDIAAEAATQEISGEQDVFYVGKTTPLGPAVFVEQGDFGSPLIGARRYSWGTAGSKPVALARGILLDATGHEELAERLCRPFTWEVVGLLPADHFRLGKAEVLAWIEDFRFGDFDRSVAA